jgi:hypothetical protein
MNYVPWPGSFPTGEPTVKIVFHGLFCFFFDGKARCEVGIHNTTHRHHPDQPHDFIVSVWTKIAGQCPPVSMRSTVGDPHAMGKDFNISVVGSAVPDGVYV